jgi:nitrite reductase/ring-hydroxylating ferredoxin subunit
MLNTTLISHRKGHAVSVTDNAFSRHAPPGERAAWERVCLVEETVPGRPIGKVIGNSGQDRDRVCVVQTDEGEFVALLDRCPHRDVALSGGIVKDGRLVCPGHFWRFDLTTGERTDLPDRGATIYPSRVVDGWVEVLLPPVQPRRPMREWLLEQARAARTTGS